MSQTFSIENYHQICDDLAKGDADLAAIISKYGYPPMWSRPNSFETLVHIILEQQVSLASALAALNKLRETIIEITPENLLRLTDEELKACYFSRQKTIYARHLAEALLEGRVILADMEQCDNDAVRSAFIKLKGIGNWTIDVYLMFVLQRADIFPIGDLAAVNALMRIKKLPKETTRETLLSIIDTWKPNRTIAAMLLWHFYLSASGKKESLDSF